MATKIFKTGFRDDLEVWSSPVLANMLWIMLCLLVITIPLAFVGLLATMFHWMDDRNTRVFTIFFSAIRQTWQKAYAVALMDILIVSFLYFNLLIIQAMDSSDILVFLSRGVTLITLVIFLMVNVYIWVLVAIWDVPLKQILKFSIQLVFAQPIWSFVTCLGFIATFVFSTILPSAAFIICVGAIAAYVACRGTWFVVTKYVPADQFALIKY
ncbi:MAG: DUF624 domain-containing protein [Aggregatilineales bacterium]